MDQRNCRSDKRPREHLRYDRTGDCTLRNVRTLTLTPRHDAHTYMRSVSILCRACVCARMCARASVGICGECNRITGVYIYAVKLLTGELFFVGAAQSPTSSILTHTERVLLARARAHTPSLRQMPVHAHTHILPLAGHYERYMVLINSKQTVHDAQESARACRSERDFFSHTPGCICFAPVCVCVYVALMLCPMRRTRTRTHTHSSWIQACRPRRNRSAALIICDYDIPPGCIHMR